MNALSFSPYESGALIASALRGVMSSRGMSFKEAAREWDCSSRALENWANGRTGQSAQLLRRMSERWPEMKPAIRAFFFLENDIDPEIEKALGVLMRHARKDT